MIIDSILAHTAQEELIESMTIVHLKNRSQTRKYKSLTAPIILTPLIDVFSILVVYLLLNFSTSGNVSYLSKGLDLPYAKNGIELERHIIVKLENGRYFVEEDEVASKDLVHKLSEHKQNFISKNKNVEFPATLVLQADRSERYKYLNSIVLAGANTGYSDIKFVVLMKQ